MKVVVTVDAFGVYVGTPGAASVLVSYTLVVTGEVVGYKMAAAGGSSGLPGGVFDDVALAQES